MKESVVQIKGGKYRYAYDPATKSTEYMGPVGSSPALSEESFLRLVAGEIPDLTSDWLTGYIIEATGSVPHLGTPREKLLEDYYFVRDQFTTRENEDIEARLSRRGLNKFTYDGPFSSYPAEAIIKKALTDDWTRWEREWNLILQDEFKDVERRARVMMMHNIADYYELHPPPATGLTRTDIKNINWTEVVEEVTLGGEPITFVEELG